MAIGSRSILTKIVCTLGPASRDPQLIARLIDEGMRIARINFSHGTLDDFKATLHAAREASRIAGVPLGVFGDLSGPKIRVTSVDDGRIDLAPGDHVEIIHDPERAGSRNPDTGVVTLACTYEHVAQEVEPGDRVLINDGAIRMLCTDRVLNDRDGLHLGDRLICSVVVGGPVTNKKGINLPDSDLSAPSMTEWDGICAEWAVENDLDFLALSFVRRGEDIEQLQALLKSLGRDHRELRSHSRLPIIAKIEMPQAIKDLDDICEVSDAIMVARGDLGVEMDLAQVPTIQKRIIQTAHDHGKPVIVATQMLESMIENAAPTRAEVSDAANAVLDGADALMLSGETAVGKHPFEAVNILARTAEQTERYLRDQADLRSPKPPRLARESKYRTAALTHGVSVVANDLGAKYVVMWSELGGSARHLSQCRLLLPVLAVSSNDRALRQMCLNFGVTPIQMDRPDDATTFLEAVDRFLRAANLADPGDAVVLCQGDPIGTPGVTNSIRVHYVGDVCRLTWHVKD
ncbi:MAG: pyruvate kinase [Planctomycetota bacterium]